MAAEVIEQRPERFGVGLDVFEQLVERFSVRLGECGQGIESREELVGLVEDEYGYDRVGRRLGA